MSQGHNCRYERIRVIKQIACTVGKGIPQIYYKNSRITDIVAGLHISSFICNFSSPIFAYEARGRTRRMPRKAG